MAVGVTDRCRVAAAASGRRSACGEGRMSQPWRHGALVQGGMVGTCSGKATGEPAWWCSRGDRRKRDLAQDEETRRDVRATCAESMVRVRLRHARRRILPSFRALHGDNTPNAALRGPRMITSSTGSYRMLLELFGERMKKGTARSLLLLMWCLKLAGLNPLHGCPGRFI